MSEHGTDAYRSGTPKVLQLTCRRLVLYIQEATPGNLGAYVRRETQGEWEHFFLATYWEDLEAIKAFAGDQYKIAVTYPDDEQYELLSDPYVFQHQVQTVIPL